MDLEKLLSLSPEIRYVATNLGGEEPSGDPLAIAARVREIL